MNNPETSGGPNESRVFKSEGHPIAGGGELRDSPSNLRERCKQLAQPGMVEHFDVDESKMTTTNQERSEGGAGSPKFPLGKLFGTPSTKAALAREDVADALHRHVTGDWGDVGEETWKANDSALSNSFRLFSSYRAANGTRFWVITEDDRSSTLVLLPEDYIFTPVPVSTICSELMGIGKRAVKS